MVWREDCVCSGWRCARPRRPRAADILLPGAAPGGGGGSWREAVRAQRKPRDDERRDQPPVRDARCSGRAHAVETVARFCVVAARDVCHMRARRRRSRWRAAAVDSAGATWRPGRVGRATRAVRRDAFRTHRGVEAGQPAVSALPGPAPDHAAGGQQPLCARRRAAGTRRVRPRAHQPGDAVVAARGQRSASAFLPAGLYRDCMGARLLGRGRGALRLHEAAGGVAVGAGSVTHGCWTHHPGAGRQRSVRRTSGPRGRWAVARMRRRRAAGG
mmetsp:Transcript_42776/g.128412  ORF Transcript_42776/g.128412 Transcript_42776/m.128412 type:complete len:272 (+) Transcript_42776:276-1091(+)